ncbi:hypothetical protein TTHERM_00182150 (macronuclear) [Tetrahymena thermophila SB210]|uniref:Uncharacterized protein n=1 Tax=Tetrahymena thermophila (strain SB210) TaxID=312017 RepID=Q22TA0_TETTS|nr:hypothetical protein TTHERM_00182150 [Tetrahymena thermophila SB210]EAR88538.3 hypothetical protein TTHERM_00182150 [Tetrahymena thermophila SB210]|eukprot:XP_001008783.3 hypothetical protein TTHERM_00182150 [Tetrahymena thermophila SB210]
MLFGVIGKQFSQSSLRNDFLMILLKNVFQEKYFEILKNNNFLQIKDLDNRNKIYQKHLSQIQIEENLERQEKDDNQFISIPTNNYKFKQEVQVNNQSEMSNILKLQELNQDEIKQADTTFTQKKQDFPEIDLSQRYNFSDKKSQTEQFNNQSYENAKIQNENMHQYQDQIQSTNRYFTEKSKLQNITFMTMLSNVPIIKKSNFTGDYSPNRFKQTQKDISHYEKQFAISLSDELQYKYVNKFLKRCQESESIDQLDEKILTSMYKLGLS